MNAVIEQALLTVGSSWALATLAKSTLIAALGLALALLERRQRAAFRHALLAGTFAVLVALPVVSAVAPPVAITLRSAPLRNPARPPAAIAAVPTRTVQIPAPDLSRWSFAALMTAAWIAGIIVFLLPAAAGLWQVLRLRRSGLPWPHGQSVVAGLLTAMGTVAESTSCCMSDCPVR